MPICRRSTTSNHSVPAVAIVNGEMTTFNQPPATTLSGETLTLSQLDDRFFEPLWDMVNEPENRRLTATKQVFNRPEVLAWLQTRPQQIDRCDWAILDTESQEFLGEVVLNDLRVEKARSMSLRICLANPAIYGQGIGTEAIRMVAAFGFETLKLDKITLEVLIDNPRAKAAYTRVGFQAGREFNEGKLRLLRMSLTKADLVRAECHRLLGRHLDPAVWSFDFDSGKRRAGLCNYTERRITISKYLVELHSMDESLQVMLHEIGHALAGKPAGHGPVWKSTAGAIGYRAERFSGQQIAANTAAFIGSCKAGHQHFRYRKPTRELSCGICAKGFAKSALITWRPRA